MKKLFLVLFLGLIALICGPPKLFASVNKNAITLAKKEIYLKNIIAGNQVSANKQFCLTKTVAADQKPILPEYKGNTTNFTLLPGDPFANIPGSRIFYISFSDPKEPIPGFGRRLQSQA